MHCTQWVSFITAVGIASLVGFVSVTSFSCSLGREPNPKENGIIRWVVPLNHRLRCQCTSIYPGGFNTFTPDRGFDPFYTERPLFTDLKKEIFNYFECENCSLTCDNGGTFKDDPCHCSCDRNWTGKTCTECALTVCENAGTLHETTCTCTCPKQWMGNTCAETRHYDCQDYYEAGNNVSGVYTIYPLKYPGGLDVYCDMNFWSGSIVIQMRLSDNVNFTRGWDEYRDGFGDMDSGSFWLGNEKVRQLTEDRDTSWKFEINTFDQKGPRFQTEFCNLRLSGVNYTIHAEGSTNCGDSGGTLFLNGTSFSTYDRDNDGDSERNCAHESNGGWWFDGCVKGKTINLNTGYATCLGGFSSVICSSNQTYNTGLRIKRII